MTSPEATSGMPSLPRRRAFLDWLAGTALGAVVLSALYPILRYVAPPRVADASATQVMAARLGQLPPNSGRIFRFGSRPGIVISTPLGEIRAFSAICTHLACTVQYRPDLKHIWCACHAGHYDLNGVNIAGPPPRPLERYRVSLKGDEVWVSRGA